MSNYTILSFCGGGIRGLFSSTLLGRLNFPTAQYANLLAGCSTGSSIVSWLVQNKSPAEISNIYQTTAANFYARQATDPRLPAYDGDLVRVGLWHAVPPVGDPPHPATVAEVTDQDVLFTSFSIGGQPGPQTPPWGGSIFTNLATDPQTGLVENSTTTVTGDILWSDAVASSGAMPGEVGTVTWTQASTGTTFTQVDGAFFNHDPTLAAVAAAVNSGNAFEDIYVICFGTGLMANWIASDTAKWGAEQWDNGDGNPNSYTPPVFMNGRVVPALNLTINGTSTTQYQDLAQMMLGSRFVYLDATFDEFIPENTIDPTILDSMVEAANGVDITAAQALINDNWPTG